MPITKFYRSADISLVCCGIPIEAANLGPFVKIAPEFGPTAPSELPQIQLDPIKYGPLPRVEYVTCKDTEGLDICSEWAQLVPSC